MQMRGRRMGMGPRGNCVCPKCGAVVPHMPGMPCREQRCPECGAKMVREGSYHHQLIEERRRKKAKAQEAKAEDKKKGSEDEDSSSI